MARCEFPPPGRMARVSGVAAASDEAGRLAVEGSSEWPMPDPGVTSLGVPQVMGYAGGLTPVVGVCAFWRERGTVPGLWGDVNKTREYAERLGISL